MTTLAQTKKARPADEWSSGAVFRPLAQLLVGPAARAGLRPTRVVLFHTALGLLAAWQVRHGRGTFTSRVSPALLIQVKTVLDNLDGQLARATNQTTETGRYLDSEMDVVVNAALLSAILGVRRGLSATLLLNLIMTVEFLWERDHREARGEVFRAPPAQHGDDPRVLAVLRGAYDVYFRPQERLLGGLFERRLQATLPGEPTPEDRVAYTPVLLNTVTANLGLSTQLLALGACVLAGRPEWYARSLPVQAGVLGALQVWREGRVRRAARARRG
ncbi:CDP-alcohol phosphatidyltransferase family protein [Deinococcus aquiradiocola]|uniref:CDP-alcohol phosphatidyltransferase n=1 Tax=Deinococcus aquiradiocola TaxID=393059 RepID=A0A917PEH7_9DEIO|nr:CDP-alcohol phosphatidyltransferase family protein [Deinococcus aquiradiocola]GGJ73000.1 CDP-alcohol phosphatidyltransferase [Deinococcus aquiradiocola]